MKFLSPHQPGLQVNGAGRFVDGRLELADADAVSIARVRAVAPHWGIQEVASWPGDDVADFDPRGVNLEGEGGVLEHLAAATDEERARIVDLERQSDRPRKTVLNYTPPAPEPDEQPEPDVEPGPPAA